MSKTLGHNHKADIRDVRNVQNKGNDFYGWFLCKRMLYSSGIFYNKNDSIEEAQTRKLNKILQMANISENHLDLGCGWGALLIHAAKYFNSKPTGVTLSNEQADFIRARAEEEKVLDKIDVKVMNAWDLPDNKKYDSITCVEMSEHIGIQQ